MNLSLKRLLPMRYDAFTSFSMHFSVVEGNDRVTFDSSPSRVFHWCFDSSSNKKKEQILSIYFPCRRLFNMFDANFPFSVSFISSVHFSFISSYSHSLWTIHIYIFTQQNESIHLGEPEPFHMPIEILYTVIDESVQLVYALSSVDLQWMNRA